MHRALVLAFLPALLAAGPVVATDEPSGPRVVLQAPTDTDVRASITFPAGWRLEAGGEDARRQVNDLGADQRCEVATRRSDFGNLATDVDDFEVTLAPGSGYIFIHRESLELPAGTVERVDFADNESGARWSVYAAWDDGYVHELWCRGDVLPDDRWLPIAETLDLDPDPALTSSPFEGTAARPDAGVAMAFDGAWQVRGSSTNQGLLYATSDTAVCALSDYSAVPAAQGWSSVDDMHDEYVRTAAGRRDLTLADEGYLDLLAGRAGFAELAFDDGTRAVRYSFADPAAERLVALFCVGDPIPEDRYLSLAESVAWLSGTDD